MHTNCWCFFLLSLCASFHFLLARLPLLVSMQVHALRLKSLWRTQWDQLLIWIPRSPGSSSACSSTIASSRLLLPHSFLLEIACLNVQSPLLWQGCDASILLQGNGTERSDPGNTSVDGFAVIDSAKRLLETFCPETVSCADILALAARDAVEYVCAFILQMKFYKQILNSIFLQFRFESNLLLQTGGPSVQIPTGRRDGRISAAANVRPNIIDTSFTLDEMAKLFSIKGLSMDDLVTLSGILIQSYYWAVRFVLSCLLVRLNVMSCRGPHNRKIALQLIQRPVQGRPEWKCHGDRLISGPAVCGPANENVSCRCQGWFDHCE